MNALAKKCVVERAAEALGMSTEGAYRLRRNSGAEGFAQAWYEALTRVRDTLTDAVDRAIHSVRVPISHDGEVVAERVQHDNRLLGMLMRAHDPERYGTPGGSTGAAVPEATREKLRAEWKAKEAAMEKGAAERLLRKLWAMGSRLRQMPDDRASHAEWAAWALFDDVAPERAASDDEL